MSPPDLGAQFHAVQPFGCETLVGWTLRSISWSTAAKRCYLSVEDAEAQVTVVQGSGTRLRIASALRDPARLGLRRQSVGHTVAKHRSSQDVWDDRRSPHWYSLWFRTTCTPPGSKESQP